MKQMSCSHFFSALQEPHRAKMSRTPVPLQSSSRTNTPKSMIANIGNLQSLQSIKDQISTLQNTLHNQTKSQNRTKERSFFSKIKDQLKQVNELQNGPFASKV